MIFDILFETCPWHTRAALFDASGRLLTLRMDDASRPFIEGSVVLGRVRRVATGMGAAFVDIGDVVDGFLSLNTLPKDTKLVEGQELMVRVARGHVDGKGARLDGRVAQKRPEGEIEVPCMISAPPSALSRALMDAGDTPVRVWVVDNRSRNSALDAVESERLFKLDEHNDADFPELLDEQLDQLHGDTFPIPGGGRLTFEYTKALTAIDVDAAQAAQKDSPLDINLRAAEELARLCRLIDIGGNIIVDFITLKNASARAKVESLLKSVADMRDMHKVEVLKMSRFGLLEINRESRGERLPVLLAQPYYLAGRILLQLWRETSFSREITIEASGEVCDILQKRLTSSAALAYFGQKVSFKPDTLNDKSAYKLTF